MGNLSIRRASGVCLGFALCILTLQHAIAANSYTVDPNPLVVPAVPALLTPLDGAHSVPETVSLRFGPVADAVRYNVQVATDAAFEDIVLQTNVPSSPVSFTAPIPSTTYFWRVQAVGSDGSSAFSEPWSFSLFAADECGLDPPTLLTPVNGATGVPESVNLRFAASTGANRYNVQVATDAAFSDIVHTANVPSSPVPFEAPIPNATYYWHVQPVGSDDTCRYGPTWHFSTSTDTAEDDDGGAPVAPQLWAPLSGTTSVPDSVQLIFSPVTAALRYNLQIATDLAFSTIIFSINVPKPPVWFVPPFENTTYYWRVQTVGAGASSKFSVPWTFSNGSAEESEFAEFEPMRPEDDSIRTLHKNFPEPFNPSTTIVFDNPQSGPVRLAVYDLTGREVFEIESGILDAGRHIYRFDATGLASGTYFYRVESPHVTETRMMTLRK